MSSSFLKAHLALGAVALIYGANYIIAKDVMDKGYLMPLAFIFLRVSTATVLFWFFHGVYVRERIKNRADWIRLAVCGLFGVALNQMFFFSGLKLTWPINASLIMTTTPVLVLIASAILLRERITPAKLLGIAMGGAGAILLIAFGRTLHFGVDSILGDFFVFCNASCYGIYLVLVKPLMKRYSAVTVVKWTFTFGLFAVAPFGIPQLGASNFSAFPLSVLLSVGYVLIFTTFFAYLFNAYALRVVNPSVVSIYIYLQPLLAATFSLLLGLEQLTPNKWLAAILIFTGVFLVSRPQPAPKPSAD